ncbi:hypothetical protein HK104_008370 [Borealophlyctis nickersoniae]|nr:hypothetical protein HK104_008370 [Borealophlyctis nickersoniae]
MSASDTPTTTTTQQPNPDRPIPRFPPCPASRRFAATAAAITDVVFNKIYAAHGASLEEFARARWNMSRMHVNRYVRAYGVMQELRSFGNKRPCSEYVCRMLLEMRQKSGCDLVSIWSLSLQAVQNREDDVDASIVKIAARVASERAFAAALVPGASMLESAQQDSKSQVTLIPAPATPSSSGKLKRKTRNESVDAAPPPQFPAAGMVGFPSAPAGPSAGYATVCDPTEEFNTPAWLVNLIKSFFPTGIQLDPATNPHSHVTADVKYGWRTDTLFVNGLSGGEVWVKNEGVAQDAEGAMGGAVSPFESCFLNPPCGDKRVLFVVKLMKSFAAGTIKEALLLHPLSPPTAYLPTLMSYPHVILTRPLDFEHPVATTKPSKPSKRKRQNQTPDSGRGASMSDILGTRDMWALFYLGNRTTEFAAAFAQVGYVPGVSSWAFGEQGDK